jgi:hypothetical protein
MFGWSKLCFSFVLNSKDQYANKTIIDEAQDSYATLNNYDDDTPRHEVNIKILPTPKKED